VERAEIIAVFSSYHDAVHYTNNLHPRKFNIKTVDFNPPTQIIAVMPKETTD
jgi:hypothetical protein